MSRTASGVFGFTSTTALRQRERPTRNSIPANSICSQQRMAPFVRGVRFGPRRCAGRHGDCRLIRATKTAPPFTRTRQSLRRSKSSAAVDSVPVADAHRCSFGAASTRAPISASPVPPPSACSRFQHARAGKAGDVEDRRSPNEAVRRPSGLSPERRALLRDEVEQRHLRGTPAHPQWSRCPGDARCRE